MKKILPLLCIAFTISLNATVYLVQQGGAGAPTWRTAVTGETVVDLTVAAKTLPVWYNATPFAAGDQVWVMNGTYVFGVAIFNKVASIYGGFEGTETTTADRAKPANAKYWEFSNETIFDGNNAVQVINGSSATLTTFYDGLTFTKMGGALKLRGKETVQNCIFKNNTTSASGAGLLMYKSGAIVKNCYFYNNSATGTASGTGIGGAIYVLNAEATTTEPNLIQDCVFDNNAATVDGAAIYIAGVSATVQNCLITRSTGGSFIYAKNASNFYNNTFVNNNGTTGMVIFGTSAVNVFNCVFWGGTASLSGGNSSTQVKNCAFSSVPVATWTVANNITLETSNTGNRFGLYYPGFTEPLTTNYALSTASSLIDKGIAISSVTNDFLGNIRPIGDAYDIGYNESTVPAVVTPPIVPVFSGLKIILKLDDFGISGGICLFTPVLNYLNQRKIKAGVGAIANKFDATALNVFTPYLNAKNDKGESLFEIWHHGLDHVNPEFKTTTYDYQKTHFEQSDQLIKQYLGVQMHSFGTPYNASDALTNKVISENTNYKVFLFSSVVPNVNNGVLYLNNKVDMENGTGNPEFEYFKTNYTTYKNQYKNYMILQGHPSGWTTLHMNQFKQIIDFLIAEGAEFVTPYGYYQSLNSSTGLNVAGFQNSGLKILPNPASSEINLKINALENSSVQVDIYSLDGKRVKSVIENTNQTSDGKDLRIDISELNNGVYLLKLITGMVVHAAKLIVSN